MYKDSDTVVALDDILIHSGLVYCYTELEAVSFRVELVFSLLGVGTRLVGILRGQRASHRTSTSIAIDQLFQLLLRFSLNELWHTLHSINYILQLTIGHNLRVIQNIRKVFKKLARSLPLFLSYLKTCPRNTNQQDRTGWRKVESFKASTPCALAI